MKVEPNRLIPLKPVEILLEFLIAFERVQSVRTKTFDWL